MGTNPNETPSITKCRELRRNANSLCVPHGVSSCLLLSSLICKVCFSTTTSCPCTFNEIYPACMLPPPSVEQCVLLLCYHVIHSVAGLCNTSHAHAPFNQMYPVCVLPPPSVEQCMLLYHTTPHITPMHLYLMRCINKQKKWSQTCHGSQGPTSHKSPSVV